MTCLLQAKSNDVIISTYKNQSSVILDSFRVEKTKRVFADELLKESEVKSNRCKRENWIWRLGAITIITVKIFVR